MPASTEHWLEQGRQAAMAGAYAQAISCFKAALPQAEDPATVHFFLAQALQANGAEDDALHHYQCVLAQQPLHLPSWQRCAQIHARQQRITEAIATLQQAIQHAPQAHELHLDLGILYQQEQQHEQARQCFEQAMQLAPDDLRAYHNLAIMDKNHCRYEQARQSFLFCLQKQPDWVNAWVNLANCERNLDRDQEARQHYQRALEIDPQFTDAHWGLATMDLQAGNYAPGWDAYDRSLHSGMRRTDPPPFAVWHGTPLFDAELLIYAEQGLGDELMFLNCLADVLAIQGACWLECDVRLHPLLQRSFPQVRLLPRQPRSDAQWQHLLPQVQAARAIGSLPALYRREAGFFRGQAYLKADPDKVHRWRELLHQQADGKPCWGISWWGGSSTESRLQRCLDWQAVAERITADPCHAWVSLQYGPYAGAAVSHTLSLPDWGNGGDLDEQAALMCALDGVLSIDNTTVHLAGALGLPCRVLLPQIPDWRWPKQGQRSLWYDSLHLLQRQAGESQQDWLQRGWPGR